MSSGSCSLGRPPCVHCVRCLFGPVSMWPVAMCNCVCTLSVWPCQCVYCVLCCAVLCCAVLCCAVLCCAVLCCAVLCCAVLCCTVLYCLWPCICTLAVWPCHCVYCLCQCVLFGSAFTVTLCVLFGPGCTLWPYVYSLALDVLFDHVYV